MVVHLQYRYPQDTRVLKSELDITNPVSIGVLNKFVPSIDTNLFSIPFVYESSINMSWIHSSNSLQLTIMKKMTDVHFTRVHCSRKSLKKANGRLLKEAGG